MPSIEIISAFIGFILTLMVFSYLIGDNPLFRIAIYLFIGVASGYAATVAWHSVLVPRLFEPLTDPNRLALTVVPLVLAVSLLAKLSPRISSLGNVAMAVLVGVGAATAVGGALSGTLIPQAQAAMDAFGSSSIWGWIQGGVTLLATIVTLAYFQFGASRSPDGPVRRNALVEMAAWAGRVVIAVTLGVLFAGVYMSALTAMIERLGSLINFVKSFFGL